MEKILVSACLVGTACRYDGKSNEMPKMAELAKKYDLVPFCPEVEAGLGIPRNPAEISHNQVIDKEGKDLTAAYNLAAEKALRLCRYFGIQIAILKDGSPACGPRHIHSGKFDGVKIDGLGVTARYLIAHGIKVYAETDELSFLLEDREFKGKTELPEKKYVAFRPKEEVNRLGAPSKEGEEKRSYGGKKPFGRKSYSSRPYGSRSEGGYSRPSYGKKSYSSENGESRGDSERKPYRSDSNRSYGHSSYHKDDYGHSSYGGDRPSYKKEGYGHSSYGGDHSSYKKEGYGHSSYGGDRGGYHSYGDRKPYAPRDKDSSSYSGERKPYSSYRKDGDRKPYSSFHKDGERKPYSSSYHKDGADHGSYGKKPYSKGSSSSYRGSSSRGSYSKRPYTPKKKED